MESFANVHIAADMHAYSKFFNPHNVKNRECREPPKKYTTPQFSQRLSRRGCVAQIE